MPSSSSCTSSNRSTGATRSRRLFLTVRRGVLVVALQCVCLCHSAFKALRGPHAIAMFAKWEKVEKTGWVARRTLPSFRVNELGGSLLCAHSARVALLQGSERSRLPPLCRFLLMRPALHASQWSQSRALCQAPVTAHLHFGAPICSKCLQVDGQRIGAECSGLRPL